jgi:signal transduction histidine kinase
VHLLTRIFSSILLILLYLSVYGKYTLTTTSSDTLAESEFQNNNINAEIKDPNERLEFLLKEAWNLRNSFTEQSLQYGLKSIELADSLKDYYNLVKGHSFTGVSYRLLGNYNKAIEYFFEGLALAKKYKIPQQEGYAYINIANLYIYLEYYQQAFENLQYALRIAQEIENKDMLSYIFLNKGRVLMHMDSIDRATDYINRSLKLRIETSNISGQADCYKYLGDIYYNKNDWENARKNYDLALEKGSDTDDRHLVGNIYLQMANIQCAKNNYTEAYSLAENAFNIGQELNSKLLIHNSLKVLSRVDLQNKRYETAARRLTQMNVYADSLYNQQLSEKVLSLEFELEKQKQQSAMDLLKKDNEIQELKYSRQRVFNIWLIIFLILMTFAGAVLLRLLKKLNEKNQQLSLQKDELKISNSAKDKMFMVIGHDLRGPVWNLRALIELLNDDQKDDNCEERSENIIALGRAVQSVSDLLENLLYWAKSQEGKIIFTPYPTNIKNLIQKSLEPYGSWAIMKNLEIKIQTDPSAINVMADENMIQVVVRNLISNAIKYSVSYGIIRIQVSKKDNKSRFEIQDTGVGIDDDNLLQITNAGKIKSSKGTGNEAGSGIGLSLCKDFLMRHNSEIKISSEPGKGSTFYFDLELAQ